MSKKIVEVLSIHDSLKNYSGKEYPVDMLREVYIKSNKSIKRIAREYNLSPKLVEKYVKAGKWDELRSKYQHHWVEMIANSLRNNLQAYVNVSERLETLKLMEIQQQLDDIEEHFTKWGDFFQRDENGEIVRDSYGQPKRVKFPAKTDSEYLMNWAKIRELSTRILQEYGLLSPKDRTIEGEVLNKEELKELFGDE